MRLQVSGLNEQTCVQGWLGFLSVKLKWIQFIGIGKERKENKMNKIPLEIIRVEKEKLTR